MGQIHQARSMIFYQSFINKYTAVKHDLAQNFRKLKKYGNNRCFYCAKSVFDCLPIAEIIYLTH